MLARMSGPALRQPLEMELFEGPFDLLLTLLLREEIDLFELPLADLVEAALGEPAEPVWDADTTGELVIVLSALAEIKLRRLLGEPVEAEPDPEAAEARERLAARVIAYAPFRAAAAWLARRAGERAGPRYRRAPLDSALAAVPRAAPGRLAEVMAPLLVAPPAPSLAHLTPRRISLPQALHRLRAALAAGRAVSFDRLVAGGDRLFEGMTLVAALELARRGEVTLTQVEPFGDIQISPPSG